MIKVALIIRFFIHFNRKSTMLKMKQLLIFLAIKTRRFQYQGGAPPASG